MKVTKFITHDNGTASRETIDVDKSDLKYHTLYRTWVDSNGEIVRYWTTDEYIHQDPTQNIKVTRTIDNRTVEVEAHCVEGRNVYATKFGDKLFNFLYLKDYSCSTDRYSND